MESELKNQDDLLQQLKNLRAENKLLEKHVFVLNECLSVDELKVKISILEKKKEKLNVLENIIERLRKEIEPLKYLKSVLENKTNTNKSLTCIDAKSINIDNLNELNTECTTSQSQNANKYLPTGSTNTDLILSQKSYDVINTPKNSNSISVVSDSSFDEYMQLLDQYDVVTDLEISNFPDKNHSKIQNITGDNTIHAELNIDNEVQGKQLPMASTYFDAKSVKGLNIQLKNEENKSIQIEEESSESSKNVNNSSTLLLAVHTEEQKLSDEEDNLKILEKAKQINESPEQAELMEHIETPNTINLKTNINSFNDMNLKIDILRGIYSLGFTNPTSLQKQVIVNCLNGRDVIVLTRPGDGKVMMFTIPLLQQIKTNINGCQALILVPTRDLAVHIQKIIMSVGDFLDVNICIGGDNIPKKLSVIPDIIVGTPIEVCAMIQCKSLDMRCIQMVVINKIDKMLSDECTNLIEQIMKSLNKNIQVTLIASDKLDCVLDMYMDSLSDPLVIISEDNKENKNDITKSLPKQFYLSILEEWKFSALWEVNETLLLERVIIYCNTLDKARKLLDLLQTLKCSVSLFYLEMSASERERTLNMFSTNHLKMIITTDPIKGCQFQYATWIINYDLPSNPICYLNRIKKCTQEIKVLNFINENEADIKLNIETYNKSSMIQTPVNIINLLEY